MNESVCRICGQPANSHAIELRNGVAHTVIYDGDRRSYCSDAWGDYQYFNGTWQAMSLIERSLKQRAGRLDVAEYKPWYPDDLRAYAKKLDSDARRYVRFAEQAITSFRKKK